ELAAVLAGKKAVAVMDKSEAFSDNGGPVFADACAACYSLPNRPMMVNIVYGLGGRDVRVEDMARVYDRLFHMASTGEPGARYTHMGQREVQ
ncbi:MAG: pyruvate ferredoxin oxidoreductase, partial [Oscillospiraceae bacterium]|nr:pyruvate ferredoxin oxidoreductase [Oscillospiraceae bacterium]